ncbi:MAG TPA: ThuA domain-containing protein [Pirellulales bacterium]|jgi:type 1 glutamine amidotransferase|nr:ThuA domain-containing protein [Pirellulales bacterium]
MKSATTKLVALWAAWSFAATCALAQGTLTANGVAAPPKLKALLFSGGGYHDYKKLTPIITDGIKKYAHVDFDVKWIDTGDDLKLLGDPKLGDGYDAIVYDICYAGSENNTKLPVGADTDIINNALRVTKEGKPTLMLHCSMHTFMADDDWTDCCGQRTRVHDKYEPFTVEKVSHDHPAVKHFPDTWKTDGDELYRTINFPESSTALLQARSPLPDQNGKVSVVCWAHTYGKGPVFGTTLGHDTKTVAQDAYLRLLADGLLWACGKLDAEGNPLAGYGSAN